MIEPATIDEMTPLASARRAWAVLFAALLVFVVIGVIDACWRYISGAIPPSETYAQLGVIALLLACTVICARYAWREQLRSETAHRRRMRRVADYDELSGLPNYAYLHRVVESTLAEPGDNAATSAMILFDLNDFKDVNERLGHQAGDVLLAAISAAICDAVGESGLAARYGGDEFVAFLPVADRRAAKELAVRVVEGIERASMTALPQNGHLPVSASYGIAVCPTDGDTADRLIEHADRALYDAKAKTSDIRTRSDERHAQDVLFAIGEAIGRSLDPQRLVINLVQAVGRSLDLDSSAIWIAQDNGEVRVRAYYSAYEELVTVFAAALAAEPYKAAEAEERRLLAHGLYTDDITDGQLAPERFATLFPADSWGVSVPLGEPHHGMLMMVARHQRCTPPSMNLAEAIVRLASASLANADLYARTRAQGEHLAALAGVGGLLFGEGTFEERLEAVVTRVAQVTGSDNLTLDTSDPTGERPFVRQFYGVAKDGGPIEDDFRELWLSLRPQLTEPDVAEFLATVVEPIVMDDPLNQVPPLYREVIERADVKTVIVMPIVWQGELKGLFYFASYKKNAFSAEDISLLHTIAAQLAPSLQVATLHVELEHSYGELKEAHREAILRLAYAAEARDPYTGRHLQRIGQLSEEIARRMGFDADEVEAIGYAAIVHDLGKLRIPDAILIKPGELNEDDWRQMKLHPEYGADLLGGGLFYELAREVALHHHERWDGSGYPFGLVGEAIPKAARIVMVADIYDALISARPYKPAWPAEKALAELMHMRGQKLCPETVDVFLAMWRDGSVARIERDTIDASFESDFRERWAA